MNSFLLSILEQGLIFSIMSLGVFITYKILHFPDLSVDGSFPLGAAVCATLLVNDINPFLACFIALIAGMLAGGITGILHVKLKITNLLSGILVMIGLYSINLRVMGGRANVPLFAQETIFSGGYPPIVMILAFAIIVKVFLDLFFKTKFGFLLKATGDNPQMVTSLGVDIGKIKIVGLMLSNGLVALSGAIMAQFSRFSDVGMGRGIIVMGLASIILGETILKRFSFSMTLMALIGTLLYRTSIAFSLRMGLPATDLQLITAIIVIIALGLNGRKFSLFNKLKDKKLGGVLDATSKKPSKNF
ncbi:ABC transporter permease [Serpentinicella sp. ANB-PHB4]|uniref:ABC transporter permease n=1 Tax=Serpentinicella sp. ANB-PHB4 TaxID=3074076 RepID=UPI00285FFF0D|nr:ABC transporter permease [Serpentinicella sp. ANB-PHB4]MDR5658951.1 ABC transporter permease [Serpentinicella sp. ANB-PHB4]